MTVDTYTERARQHMPLTLEGMREAAMRMRAEGHSEHGISAALGVAVEMTRKLIGCIECDS